MLREDCIPGAHGGFSSRIYAGREAWTIVQPPAAAAAAAAAEPPAAGAAQRTAGGGRAAALGGGSLGGGALGGGVLGGAAPYAWSLEAEAREGALMMHAEPVTARASGARRLRETQARYRGDIGEP